MNDNTIKMVALDLDGTTLNERSEISPRTVDVFRKAMEKGVHIVICTGRTFQSLPKQLFSIEGLEYIITSNGAHITAIANMETVYENNISADAVQQIIDALRFTGYSVETFVKGHAYIAKDEYDDMVKNGSSFRNAEYVIRTRNPVPDFFAFMCDHKHEIENISINFPFPEDRDVILHLLRDVNDITITSSFHHNLEIGGATTSKAQALSVLMAQLGLDESQLMAAGDSPNDAEMIKLASLGVVMGNASDEMKALGDYITDSNDNDGVAKAIEKFVLFGF